MNCQNLVVGLHKPSLHILIFTYFDLELGMWLFVCCVSAFINKKRVCSCNTPGDGAQLQLNKMSHKMFFFPPVLFTV